MIYVQIYSSKTWLGVIKILKNTITHGDKHVRELILAWLKVGPINEQTGLTVVINVHLPVFLMGNLIRNLLVAAGLLSYPITDPLCQNLCHRQLTPPPSPSIHLPRVSYDICVSGSCDGMLLACYFSAGAPCWLPSISQPRRCCCRGWVTCQKAGAGTGGGGGVSVHA